MRSLIRVLWRQRPILKLLVEFASGAGNEDSPGNAALPILHPLYDAGWLAALGAIGALGRIHHFLAICGLGDLGHYFS